MSAIEWTDRTWNPVRGCTHASPGCLHCYAEKIAARFSGPGRPFEGYATRRGWTGRLGLIPEKLDEPLRWRKPRRVFVNSMSDLFHESLPDEAIDQVFAVMALAPQHTFQVLTKRAKRMREWVSMRARSASWLEPIVRQLGYTTIFDGIPLVAWPFPNVWLGVSAEDQQRFDERVDDLIATPAAVRFLSLEPLLGPIDVSDGPLDPESTMGPWSQLDLGIHWVITGGESGRRARPCNVAWIRSIVQQCEAAAVPLFVKQLGARPISDNDDDRRLCGDMNLPHPFRMIPCDSKGGDPEEWPADLRVREFPA